MTDEKKLRTPRKPLVTVERVLAQLAGGTMTIPQIAAESGYSVRNIHRIRERYADVIPGIRERIRQNADKIADMAQDIILDQVVVMGAELDDPDITPYERGSHVRTLNTIVGTSRQVAGDEAKSLAARPFLVFVSPANQSVTIVDPDEKDDSDDA